MKKRSPFIHSFTHLCLTNVNFRLSFWMLHIWLSMHTRYKSRSESHEFCIRIFSKCVIKSIQIWLPFIHCLIYQYLVIMTRNVLDRGHGVIFINPRNQTMGCRFLFHNIRCLAICSWNVWTHILQTLKKFVMRHVVIILQKLN